MLTPRTLPDREDLGPVLPLPTPYVLMVDPSSACNLRCKFCPTGDPRLIKETGRFQGFLSMERYEKLIADLDTFDKPIRILRLYKEGEPLLNPHFCDMVRLAKASGRVERVDTTTNGIALTHSLSEDLVASGIDQINISVNGLTTDQYQSFTRRRVDTEVLFDEIDYLCRISGSTTIYVKCIGDHLSVAEQAEFTERFMPVADKVFIENLQPNWPQFSFEYMTPEYGAGHYGQPLEDREVCPFIFYMMVVNSDGSVSACVQDWNHTLVAGTLDDASLGDLWNGAFMTKLRRSHLSFERECFSNCASCPVLRHGCLDNIDPHADAILGRMGP